MRVFIGHTFFLRFDPKEWRQKRPYAPLGTLYAVRVARDAGHEVSFFDAMLAENENDIVPAIKRAAPRATIFFEDNFNYLSKMCLTRMREACFRMANYAKAASSLVIAQGSDPVDHLHEYFTHGVDVVICGEGEETLAELLAFLERTPQFDTDDAEITTELRKIDGIAFRHRGDTITTQRRAPIRHLDTIAFPAWDAIDLRRYRRMWMLNHGTFSMNMVTTRGCPYHCNWCAKPVYGHAYNSRSPQNVVAELEILRERFGAQHIWYADDIFGLKPGWIGDYAARITEAGIATPFKCQSRADILLRESNVEQIARAGCESVWIGAESGAQSVLDAMEKGITIEQIEAVTRQLRAHKVKVGFFLQFGYPGEQQSEIAQTLDMVRRCAPDDIGISVSYPLPGTPFYDRVRSALTGKQNWTTSGDLELMYPGAYHPRFYRALHTAVHKRFRIRQAFAAIRARTWSEQSVRRILLIGWNSVELLAATIRLAAWKVLSPKRHVLSNDLAAR